MVEDDPAIRELVTIVLDEANITVKACSLGWTAHRCIRTHQPDVVLLDLQMPEVDGIQLFDLLREDPKTKHIPVIFLTATPEKLRYDLPNYQDLGAVLLPKPFRLTDLLELVRTAGAL